MQHVHIDQFTVSGLTVRTKNSTERDPKKAKIGSLWQKFFQDLPATEETVTCYGIYSNYESDENGEFDLTAGIKGSFPAARSSEVTIPAGTYLRFEKKGALPMAVIELWQEIWQYFSSVDVPQRLFKCDFEEYQDIDTVAIYIGIKKEENND